MRALTVDCVMLSLRPASMKLPVSATIRKVRASAMSIARTLTAMYGQNVSIENVDRRQWKNAFGIWLKNFHIDRARTRFGKLGHDGRTDYEGEEGKEGSEEESGEEEEEVGPRRVHPLRLILPMRLAGVVGAIGLLLSSTAAHAVSITNRDDQDHKVTIVEGDTKTEHVLKPSQVLNGICAKGCTVHLDDDEEEEYQLEADDVVSIEEGSLYYDTPDTPAGPAPATGDGKPATKG